MSCITTLNLLTHWGSVTYPCTSNLTIIGSDNRWSAPSHYLNQCWIIVNGTHRNRFRWIIDRNSCIFVRENPFKMSSGKWRPFCLVLNVLIPRLATWIVRSACPIDSGHCVMIYHARYGVTCSIFPYLSPYNYTDVDFVYADNCHKLDSDFAYLLFIFHMIWWIFDNSFQSIQGAW